ncbi:MAG: helix-turn-helix transcriptional regulator, partial [Paracoccaceae bacterium]
EALVKIDAVLPDGARELARSVQIHAIAMPGMSDEVRARIDELEAAVDARTRLNIAYRDGDERASQRDVRPLALWFWGKVWTLIAWCELREDFRMFRIDRIGAIRESGRFRAERDKGLSVFFAREAHLRDPNKSGLRSF